MVGYLDTAPSVIQFRYVFTTGCPGEAGYVEVLWPLLKTENDVKTDDEVSE
jgi:hypothetical protein